MPKHAQTEAQRLREALLNLRTLALQAAEEVVKREAKRAKKELKKERKQP